MIKNIYTPLVIILLIMPAEYSYGQAPSVPLPQVKLPNIPKVSTDPSNRSVYPNTPNNGSIMRSQ